MNRESALEYSESLDKIGGGAVRTAIGVRLQLAWARRQNVHKALGMTWDAWVAEYVGGWVRLALEDRRDTALMLTAPEEEGGMGLSGRQAADVLGVAESTVRADLDARNRADEPEPEPEPARNRAPEPEPEPEPEPDQPSFEDMATDLVPEDQRARHDLDAALIIDLAPLRQTVKRWQDYVTDEHRQLLEQTASEFLTVAKRQKPLEVVR